MATARQQQRAKKQEERRKITAARGSTPEGKAARIVAGQAGATKKRAETRASVAKSRAEKGLTQIAATRNPGQRFETAPAGAPKPVRPTAPEGFSVLSNAQIEAQGRAQNLAETKAREAQAALDTEKGEQLTTKKVDFFNQDLSLDAKRLSPSKFADGGNFESVINNTPQAADALNAFRGSNPDMDVDFNNKALQRRVDRELIRAKEKGSDPTDAIEKLFEDQRFQKARTQAPVETTSELNNSAGGVQDVNASQAASTLEVNKEYITSDLSSTFSQIMENPADFLGMNSTDYITQKYNVSSNLALELENESLKSLLNQSALIKGFSEQSKAFLEKSRDQDLALLDAKSIKAQARLDLEKMKLQAAEDRTMRPLREKQARMEGYLKMKLNVEGLDSSASGLSLLVSQLTAFDQSVSDTQLQFSLAAQELALGGEDLMLDYTSKEIEAKRNFDASVLKIDAGLTDSLIGIEKDRLAVSSSRKVMQAEALGNAINEKQAQEAAMQQQQIDNWKFAQEQQIKLMEVAVKQQDSDTKRQLADQERIEIDAALASGASAQGGLALPKGDKYGYSITDTGGIKVDAAEGDDGGQCGTWVNDLLGDPRLFGDTFAQKMTNKNSDKAVPGAAFIMDTGTRTGHVGFVESVNPDGSINIVDSNYGLDERVQRRTIKQGTAAWNSIKGYHIPDHAITEADVILSQIGSGNISVRDINDKTRALFKKEGRLPELNAALNEPKNKLISEGTAKRLNIDSDMNRRDKDSLIEKRTDLGFGNEAFQSLDSQKLGKGLDAFQKFFDQKRKLDDIFDTLKQFNEAGGSLQKIASKIGRETERIGELRGEMPDRALDLYRELEQKSGTKLVEFVKEISGVAVSEQEFQRLQKLQLNTSMTDSQFLVAMNTAFDDWFAGVQRHMGKFGFTSASVFEDALGNFGSMPTNLDQIEDDTSSIFDELGFDDGGFDFANQFVDTGGDPFNL